MKIIAMVPTYNEKKNIGVLVKLLHRDAPKVEVLVVDDSSPDETYLEVKKLAKKDKKLHLLLRNRAVKGRGWAGRDGFVKALAMWAPMWWWKWDADLSHQPKYIAKP